MANCPGAKAPYFYLPPPAKKETNSVATASANNKTDSATAPAKH